jgi:hydroxymethylpyrimidine/phosphomethylpyrimidine kinase
MIVLAIGGLDPSGGAGILQDARTIEDLGGRAMVAATAWTAQSSRGVTAWEPVAPAVLRAQVDAVLGDFDVRAVKIGMVGAAANAEALADVLQGRNLPIVLDPVLAASLGGALGGPDVVAALRALLPRVRVVTPNLDEAEALAGRPARTIEEMAVAARELLAGGAAAAMTKGGHLDGDPCDVLADAEGVLELRGSRIGTAPVHGTGCVLASALAFHLAAGLDVRCAAALARDHLRRRLERAVRLGAGPLAHL